MAVPAEYQLLVFKYAQSLDTPYGRWRLVNPTGLPHAGDISPHSLQAPENCDPRITNSVASLLASWEGQWRFVGMFFEHDNRSGLSDDAPTCRAILERIDSVKVDNTVGSVKSGSTVGPADVSHISQLQSTPGRSHVELNQQQFR